jgi:hypothetical protein
MQKQRGAIELVYLIVLAVIIAAFAGLWTYYHTQIAELEEDVKTKQKVITTMATEKAECLAEKTGLQTANTSFKELVVTQNKALEDLRKARDAKAVEAQRAQAEADKQSLVFKGRIADILAQTAGTDWCGTWSKMVTDYTKMRQAK